MYKRQAEQVSNAVAGAIRCGYRMFDCAACYQNEDQIGEVFKAAFDEGVVERKDLFIMTKVWNDMHRDCLLYTSLQNHGGTESSCTAVADRSR